jgi:hypothetical protein
MESKTMTFTEHIRQFLRDRPLISVRGLESRLKIPRATLMRPGRDIPHKYHFELCRELAAYGLTIGLLDLRQEGDGIALYSSKGWKVVDRAGFERFLEDFFG